jgi:hypothetical protein
MFSISVCRPTEKQEGESRLQHKQINITAKIGKQVLSGRNLSPYM